MVKFLVGLFLGVLLGLSAMAMAQHIPVGSGTGATPPENVLFWTTNWPPPPTSFVFAGKDGQELLRIHQDGRVILQGRLLGTDKEVWDGLRAVMNPWRVCQEIEENMQWPSVPFQSVP